MYIPDVLLKKLYTVGSLKNAEGGAQFALKNRLSDAEVVALREIAIDGTRVPLDAVKLEIGDGAVLFPAQLDDAHPLPFPLRSTVTVQTGAPPLTQGQHQVEIALETRPFGNLRLVVEDAISAEPDRSRRLPRDERDDFTSDIIRRRQTFIEQTTGKRPKHLVSYSFDPHVLKGNCENFVGVAQVPIGFAGPLRVCGEHADGEFLIPMATTEGAMIASYNRGMKLLNMCGGVKATVVADAMQRAPAFVFEDARGAREFVSWVRDNTARIRGEAESSSKYARLQYIDPFLASRFAFLRFNFSTGDAAGQNMVGRATFAACRWILEHYDGIKDFFLESNFATDKKDSYINRMRSRGKRVIAEVTIPHQLIQQLRVNTEKLILHHAVGNVGAFLSGASNNGLQSANAIAALFIATGQDVANLAESSPAIISAEVTASAGMYLSLTIPSLIVATHGGGTGLATQRECLEIMGCYGKGNVNKLAEIIGGVALAGEISLAAAISSADWVSSHEKFGRNR